MAEGARVVVAEVLRVAAVLAEAPVVEVAVGVVVEIKKKVMKKIILYTIPVLISLIWLFINHQTLNPISLKGPYFLTFYLILLFGFYTSTVILIYFREKISKLTFCLMISILFLGVIKLMVGISLHKPFGYLLTIIILEMIITFLIFLKLLTFNAKI
ncbi:FtsH-binding integral membrane protein [Chryseobacterium sp. JUb7]|nr:FtsH-binding integral membrane protein [Chryseobacterium sp. JUb7]